MTDANRSGRRADAASSILIGDSPEMLDALRAAMLVANTTATVLIRGERGTGKKLLARFLHERSGRPLDRFVFVDCAALGERLADSVEAAIGGTLYLSDVAELSTDAQRELLAVLDARADDRPGRAPIARVNVRLVAATRGDLDDEVAAGRFRADLYYRLAVVELTLPPLRERGEDVRMLAEHFVGSFALANGRYAFAIARETLVLLRSHPWPGNVRQLKDALERAAATSDGPLLVPADLPAGTLDGFVTLVRPGGSDLDILPLDELERQHIEHVVATVDGDLRHAAQLLGIRRGALQRRLREYGYG